jgi:pyochelin biosynthetic protein PchC
VRAITPPQSAWLRQFHSAPDAPTRLICFPHAGGAANYYFPVSKALVPAVDMLAVQYPGRHDRRQERALESINELADRIAIELKPWLDRPLALFGHSMGATLAFEVGRRLQASQTKPLALFVSGRAAPSRQRTTAVHQYDNAAFVQELKRLGGTDSRVLDDEVLWAFLPAIRSDYKAIETYRYQPGELMHCPIFALCGNADIRVDVNDVLAWREHTSGEFDLTVFPGGHFYLNEQAPAVAGLTLTHLARLSLQSVG